MRGAGSWAVLAHLLQVQGGRFPAIVVISIHVKNLMQSVLGLGATEIPGQSGRLRVDALMGLRSVQP